MSQKNRKNEQLLNVLPNASTPYRLTVASETLEGMFLVNTSPNTQRRAPKPSAIDFYFTSDCTFLQIVYSENYEAKCLQRHINVQKGTFLPHAYLVSLKEF